MTELKPCPKQYDDIFKCRCHIEIIRTKEVEPKNIRIICHTHTFVLPGSYTTVEEAIKAWNRRASNG